MKAKKSNYLYEIVKSHRSIYISIIIFSFLAGSLASFNIVAIYPLLNFIMPEYSSQNQQPLLTLVESTAKLIPIENPVVSAAAFLFVVTILSLMVSLFLAYLIGRGASSVGYNLKDRLFKRYAASGYQFFAEHKQGEILYYLFSAPQNTMALFMLLPQLAGECIHILFLVGLLFAINLKFTIFVIGFIALFNGLITAIARMVLYTLGKKRRTFAIKQQVITNEFINGVKHILIYLAKPRWIADFDRANRKLRSTYLKETMWLSVPKGIIELSMYLFIIVVVLLAQGGALAIKDLAGIALYLMACVRLLPHVTNVGRMRMKAMRLLPDAEAVSEVITSRIEKPADGTKKISCLRSPIRFENIHFAYKDRPPLLKGLSFEIEPMKTTAIVGTSGSGKTTLINLFLKLLTPSRGEILVEGANLRDYITESWLTQIGFVSQEPFIFHSTIKNNITFGHDGYSMEEITRAAKIAYADEFINNFPDKYETLVGEKGMKLSTGQQQRIAIARAVIRNPNILIFDEATNALDNISEAMLQNAIDYISKTKTVIVIAHRLSTIRNADKIVVIRDGVNVEEGDHDSLICAKSHYWDMYSAAK